MADDNTYVCEACKGEFTKGVPDAVAMAEFKRDFPGTPDSDRHIVCHDCYQKMIARRAEAAAINTTFEVFRADCIALIESIYARGERTEGWHLLVRIGGKVTAVELPMDMPRDMFKTIMVPSVRGLLQRLNAAMFATSCEAWMLDHNSLPDNPTARKDALKHIRKDGISKNPDRGECINLCGHHADGANFMCSWKIAYDDMRKPRLGEMIWDVVVNPGEKGAGIETWWTRVFDAPKETRQ